MTQTSRRHFIKNSTLATTALLTGLPAAKQEIMTVKGWLPARKLAYRPALLISHHF